MKNLTDSIVPGTKIERVAEIVCVNAPAFATVNGLTLQARHATTAPRDLVLAFRAAVGNPRLVCVMPNGLMIRREASDVWPDRVGFTSILSEARTWATEADARAWMGRKSPERVAKWLGDGSARICFPRATKRAA